MIATFVRNDTGLAGVDVRAGGFMELRTQPGASAPQYPEVEICARGFAGEQPTSRSVVGKALARLSDGARWRLPGRISAQPMRRRIAGPSVSGPEVEGLVSFLALFIRANALVAVGASAEETSLPESRQLAVVSRDGGSLAALAAAHGAIDRIELYGSPKAGDRLAAAVGHWHRAGRPRLAELQLAISTCRPPRGWHRRPDTGGLVGLHWRMRRVAKPRDETGQAGR